MVQMPKQKKKMEEFSISSLIFSQVTKEKQE
jgi:hypothetical protein